MNIPSIYCKLGLYEHHSPLFLPFCASEQIAESLEWADEGRLTVVQTESRYELSGVTLYTGKDDPYNIRVPDNPKFVPEPNVNKFLGATPGKLTFSTGYFTPHAYPIHERYWVLMTGILDVDLVKEHFYFFLRAPCHQAKRNVFEPDDLLVDDYQEHWGEPSKKYNKSKQYLELHNDEHPFEGCCIPHDPLNIPELRDLLQNPQIIQQEAQKSNNQITSQHISSTSNTSNIAAPTDIILMIMDLLPGRRDLEFLLLAFPKWRSRITQIPQVFWRRRCINDYHLLEDALPTVDEMDWQWFYSNVDQMLSNSNG